MNEEKVSLEKILLTFPVTFLLVNISVLFFLSIMGGIFQRGINFNIIPLLMMVFFFFPSGIFVFAANWGVNIALFSIAGHSIFISVFILSLIFRQRKYFRVFIIVWISLIILNIGGLIYALHSSKSPRHINRLIGSVDQGEKR
jgi:hypothetical protein